MGEKMSGGRGDARRQITGFMADKTKEEWVRIAIDQHERIAQLEAKVAKLQTAIRYARDDLSRLLGDLAERTDETMTEPTIHKSAAGT